jgi:poly(3-hydroxybutyrate) depolymerase
MPAEIDKARLKLFSEGRTTVFSYRGDPRFAYCLYTPPPRPEAEAPGLIVAMHHSNRNFVQVRDSFAELAERTNQVVLAPLFPADVLGDGNVDGYKYLIEGDLRYDLLLHDMIRRTEESTGCDGARFCMFGFSGGGHFAHRYMLVHAERLKAVSIAAPGQVSLPDRDADWWVGIRDVPSLFGKSVDFDALRRVKVQLIVGESDTETWEITHRPGSRYWRAESDKAGKNRIERLRSLQRALKAEGVSVQFDMIPGAAHISTPAMELSKKFLEKHLQASGT